MKAIYTIQNFAKRFAMVLAIGLMAINTWGATYNSVGTTLTSGKSYIIVAGGKYAITASNPSSGYIGETDVESSISGSVLTTTATNIVWVATVNASSQWTFKNGDSYINNNSGTSYRNMSYGTGGSTTYTISSNKIYSTGDNSKWLQRLSGGNFRMYNSTQSGASETFVFYELEESCAKSVTVSNGGSSTNGTITSITTSPVATCSSTATDRQVSIVVTPSTGYDAPENLSVGSSTGTVTSTKVSRTNNNNGTFTFVYRYNQNDNGTISYNAACVAKTYTITLNNQDPTTASTPTSITATYNSSTGLTGTVVTTRPTKTGYTFGGYYTGTEGSGVQLINSDGEIIASASGGGKTYTDASKKWVHSGNVTVYAKWTERPLTNYRTTCCTGLTTVSGKISVGSINETGGTASWSWSGSTTGISKNILKIYNTSDVLVKTIDNISALATSQSITGLTPCTSYYATLTTVASSGYCDGAEQGKSDNFTTNGWAVHYEGGDENEGALLSNVTKTSGASQACLSENYVATFTANTGYDLPTTITVYIASSEVDVDDAYTWSISAGVGTLTVYTSELSEEIEVRIIGVAKTYTASDNLDKNGGDAHGQYTATYNATSIAINTTPTRAGYTVEGYYKEEGCTNKVATAAGVLQANKTYTDGSGKWIYTSAPTLFTKWTETTHTVNVASGGNGNVSPASVSGVGITTASGDITATPNTGYHFDNWTLPSGVTAASTYSATSNPIRINATADSKTITANFAINQHTITWKSEDGTSTLETDASQNYGTATTFDGSAPTKATTASYTYTFDGWTTAANGGGTFYANGSTPTVSGDATYYAHFSATANVASVTVGGATDYYTTLAGAMDDAMLSDNSTIKILDDISGQPALTYNVAKKCTLDLNNHTVAGTVTKLLTINNASANFTITDNSVAKGGVLKTVVSSNARVYCLYLTAGTVNMENGKVYCQNTYTYNSSSAKNVAASAVYVTASQTFTMNNGTLESEAQYGSYALYIAQGTSTVTVNGGRIKGYTNKSTTASGIYNLAKGLTINNGHIIGHSYTSTSYGLYLHGGHATVNGGTIEATNDTTNNKGTTTAYGIYVAYNSSSYKGVLTIPSSSTVNVLAKARTTTAGAVNIGGGSTGSTIEGGTFTAWTKTSTTAYGIYSSGDITVSGGTFNVNSYGNIAYGIYSLRGKVTINSTPTFNVKSGGTTAYGAFAYGTIGKKGTGKYSGTIEVNSGTFNVTSTTTTAYGAYAGLASRNLTSCSATNDTVPGMHYMPGIIDIKGGTFNVTATTTGAYGIVVAAAKSEYGTVGTTTRIPLGTITGGKFYVQSSGDANATAYAMNSSTTAARLVVEGGYYSTDKTDASSNPTIGGKYTAPKKSCNYRVFPISPALESKYNYKVAQFYTITYNKGSNGTGTVDPGYKAIGDDITITSSTFTRTGYTQTAWNTNSAGTGGTNYAFGATYSTDADLTLYPTWTANTYTVTFDREGGSGGSSSVTATYDAAMPSITAPTKTGYTFGGYWDGDGGTGTQYYNANGTSARTWNKASNTTLYAKWTANTITITWNPNGEGASVTPTSSSYTYDGSTVTLPTPTRPLSVFTGWYTEESGGTEITDVGTTNKPTEDVTYYAHWRVLTFEVKDQAGTGTADIHLTSTRNVAVYATSACGNLITIKADNLDAISNLGGGTANKQNIQIKYLDANNGDAEVAKASSPFRLCNDGSSNYNIADDNNINLNGLTDYSQTYSISYTPSEYGKIDHYKLQLRLQNNNTNAITITFDLYGRSLPDEFVIAAKYADDNKWYALPNTLGTTSDASAPTPIEISVDNTTTPTKAMNVPSTLLYKACDRFQNSPNTQFASIRFTSNGTNHLQASTSGSDYQLWLTPSDNAVKQNWYLKSSNFGSYLVQMDPAQGSSKMIGFYNASGIKMGFHGTAPKGCDIYFLPVEYTDMSAEIMEWGTDHVVVDLRSAGSATKVKTQVGTGAVSSAQTLASIKKDEGVYRVAVTLSESDAAKNLKLLFYNDSEVMQGGAKNTIPLLISDDDATTGSLSLSKDDAATCDLVVLDGGVLTVSETTDGEKFTFQDLYVYGGGKMVVPSGTYISFSNVYLRGGHLNSSWEYQYSNPQLVLNGTMGNSSNTINYDYLTNNAQFYSLALPYQVQLANIVNPYFNNKRSWEIHAYDGAKRASGSQVDGWYDVEVGSTGANTGNIAALTSSSYLTPGVGYTFWGAMQKVNSIRQKWSINRFPMTLASGSAETAKAGVSVGAYGMTDGMPNDGVAVNDAGWNMLGNPYLANIGGTESFESSLSALIVGYHNEKELDGSGNWTGAWKEVEDAANVRYVRIPHDNGMDYDQVRVKDATFKSFRHFFIQAATSGTFTFSLSQRAQEAPARVQNNGATLPDEMDIDFILSNGEEQATFGLTVNDKLNTGFVVGEDMPEELGGTSSKAYTIAAENKLAYNGLPSTAAEQYIPVGYRAEAAGTYTFAYKPDEYTTYIEHIRLIDYATGDVTDLLDDTYEFSTEQGIFDERFALNVEFGRRNIPTGIEGTGINADQPVKFIRDDKMYILRNGVIYDATGKRVIEINK